MGLIQSQNTYKPFCLCLNNSHVVFIIINKPEYYSKITIFIVANLHDLSVNAKSYFYYFDVHTIFITL